MQTNSKRITHNLPRFLKILPLRGDLLKVRVTGITERLSQDISERTLRQIFRNKTIKYMTDRRTERENTETTDVPLGPQIRKQ